MDEHRGRALVVVAAIFVGAAVLALVVTGWMRGSSGGDGRSISSGPPSGAPSAVAGAQVISVADAVKIQAVDSSTDLAVAGWYQQSYALPCPAPIGPIVPLLDGDCEIAMTWLMNDPEVLIHSTRNATGGSNSESPPVGPAVHPVFDGPGIDWANPLPQDGDSRPTPVVFIGHFDDARAAGCPPADHQACLDRFVVTKVAWANGQSLP